MRQNLQHRKSFIFFIATFFAFLGISNIGFGQAIFTSNNNGNWNNAGSWTYTGSDADGIPDANDNVTVNNNNDITVTANASCTQLTLFGNTNNRTTELIVNSGITLSISGACSISASNGNRRGQLTNNGTIELGSTVSFQTSNMTYVIGASSTFNYNGASQTVETIPSNNYASLTLSGSGTKTLPGAIVINNNFTMAGSATTTPTNSLTVTGTTTLNNTSSLILGAANILSNSGAVVLNGGTFSTGSTTGYSETVGTLNLNSNSIINLGTGSHSLNFTASNGVGWAGSTLTISGWNGTAGSSGTAGQIFVGTDNTGLTSSQLSKISFSGYSAGAQILNTGEVVPLTTSPTFSVSPTSIDFGFIASGSTDTQTFTLTGSNLDGTDVTIDGSFDFQVSTDGSPFSNSVTISGYGTSISKVVTVQFAPSAANTNYPYNIVVSGGGAADDEVVAVIGNSNITYCESNFTNQNDEYITNVNFAGINKPSGADVGGPVDYTDNIAYVEQGATELISVTIVADFSEYIYAFIDWNQNGTLNDAGEVYTIAANTNLDGPHLLNIAVPIDASMGNTRMRVMVDWDNDTPDPCRDATYGEAEDYTVNVTSGCTTPVIITCPANVTAYTNPISGLQTYYNFNETTGTTASDNAGSNDATLENGATWGNGQICNAVSLDGNNDFIDLPDGIVSGLNDFTISTWVYWEGGGNWQRIFDFGNSNSAGYMFLTPGNGGEARFAISLTDYTDEDVIQSGDGELPENQWVHVAVSLNGSSGVLYVNGINVGENNSMSLTPDDLGSTPNNWIGQSQYADPFFNGLIDEFRIYSRALSENEIKTLANTGTCAAYPDLGTPTTSGGCGTIELTNDAVMPMSVGTHTVTWTATGGPSPVTCTQTVTVENNYPSPTFTTQPNSTYTVEPGNGTAVIATAVSGCDLSYQWQASTDDGSTWTDISDASAYYLGTQTDELSIADPISDMNGYWYQLVATAGHYCGTSSESDPAELIVSDGTLGLITSPGSQCKYGDDVTVTVSASSESYSGVFRWYSDAAGNDTIYTSASNVSYSDYTVTISSNQTYYVEFESGGEKSDITPVTAYAIIPPELSASVGGTFCTEDTIKLFSDGDYDNIYWEGPDGFYSTDEDPEIPDATTDMSGTYTVHTNSLSGINLVTNGDFEAGNTDFSSSYSYVAPTTNALWPEGLYTITNNPKSVHDNFYQCSPVHGNQQLIVNGNTSSTDTITWSQTVNVVENTNYQFSYFVQSVEYGSPSQLQLYINGTAAGEIYEAEYDVCQPEQFIYNWNSGGYDEAELVLVNKNRSGAGNDFALDSIVFQHTCTAEASVEVIVGSGFTPDVTIAANPNDTICNGDLVTFTATPINGGTSPSYQWYRNGVPVNNETNITFTPATINDQDKIYCEMTTSLSCISGSATVDSDVLTITVFEPPTAIAGGNLFSCGISPVEITSGASATNYSSIEWTSTGSGIFSDAASLTACTYTPSAADITAGNVIITLTASGNSPCGDEVDTKTLTFTDPIDVKADYLFTDYCPQFLPPVSFNNDDDPRPPGRTELNFVLVPLNASANWQFELDFDIVATPGVSGTLSIDELAVIENGTEITATGGIYTADASTDTIFINALVVNKPGHSLDVIIDAINVTSAGCAENEEDNNTSTITIYPMPAIGKFE